jgi:hypothetical protein
VDSTTNDPRFARTLGKNVAIIDANHPTAVLVETVDAGRDPMAGRAVGQDNVTVFGELRLTPTDLKQRRAAGVI